MAVAVDSFMMALCHRVSGQVFDMFQEKASRVLNNTVIVENIKGLFSQEFVKLSFSMVPDIVVHHLIHGD